MSRPPVSVVMPVRDGERYIAEALDSILSQDPPPDEVVVVDDGSQDQTAALAQRAGRRVRVVQQARIGSGSALNRGIVEARSEIIGFCDADDLWMPGKLDRQLEALETDPAAAGVGGLVEQFVSPDAPELVGRVRLRTDPMAADLLGALLVRRSAFDAIGTFNERFDNPLVDWISRARVIGIRFLSVDEVVLRRRIHGANWSIVHREKSRSSLLRIARLDRERRLTIE